MSKLAATFRRCITLTRNLPRLSKLGIALAFLGMADRLAFDRWHREPTETLPTWHLHFWMNLLWAGSYTLLVVLGLICVYRANERIIDASPRSNRETLATPGD